MTLPAPQIKKMAHELGFDEVGITSFAKLEEGARAIREWVKEGRHGSMKYLEDLSRGIPLTPVLKSVKSTLIIS